MTDLSLFNLSTCVSKTDAAFIVCALQAQMVHVCRDWSLEHVLVGQREIDQFGLVHGWTIALVDEMPEAQGDAGYHDVTAEGTPYAVVCAQEILAQGGTVLGFGRGLSVSAVASHEAVEMAVNPTAGVWVEHNGQQIALECCDPVEGETIPISFALRSVLVSNYVLPSFFSTDGKAPFDWKGTVRAPFTPSQAGRLVTAASAHAELLADAAPFRRRYPRQAKTQAG